MNSNKDKIFNIGDKVFDITYGWGVVCYSPNTDNTNYPVKVRFDNERLGLACLNYASCGRKIRSCGSPTLSFEEYTLNGFTQEKPYKEYELVYFRRAEHEKLWQMGYYKGRDENTGRHIIYLGQKKEGHGTYAFEISRTNPLI